MSNIERAAETLIDALHTRAPLPHLSADLAPQTPAEAYAIQALIHTHRAAQTGATAGYKLAYTAYELQQAAGLEEPLFARITANAVQDSPARVDDSNLLNPGLECEVAFRIGRDLPPRDKPYSRDEVIRAIEAVMPAIEVIDMRAPEGLNDQERALLGLTVGCWNTGIVLGAEAPNWHNVDLAAATGRVVFEGKVVAEGAGNFVMGHPLEPLVWLANALGSHGQMLKAGMIVITGSFVRPAMVQNGLASVDIEGLGSVAIRIGR